MSDFANVRLGKLKLKGVKEKSHKKRKHKKDKVPSEDKKAEAEELADIEKHGGWRAAKKVEDIVGPVAIEFGKNCYVKALDSGLFTLGAPHDDGDGPAPEEILTAIVINETRLAFKSGYGKYVGIDKSGIIIGRSDAVGPMEQWEPIFQEGKMALLANNGRFVRVDEEDDAIVAKNVQAGDGEMLSIRCNKSLETDKPESAVPTEEQGNLAQVELNYIKKFQKFQDKRVRICDEDRQNVKKAKTDGNLHEVLLDRRSKMKADRYCK
nr:EOG090X0DUJ [Triops cancriformis]